MTADVDATHKYDVKLTCTGFFKGPLDGKYEQSFTVRNFRFSSEGVSLLCKVHKKKVNKLKLSVNFIHHNNTFKTENVKSKLMKKTKV